MSVEEKAKKYASQPEASTTVSIRRMKENAFLAGHASRDDEIRGLKEERDRYKAALEKIENGGVPIGKSATVGERMLEMVKLAGEALRTQGLCYSGVSSSFPYPPRFD